MQVLSRQRGVSLIEVLMAVLIFSVSLIGMAGLLMMATRSNQAAYLRTQVAFLAGNMADRMRANPAAVWDGSYNQTIPFSGTQNCQTASCTPDQLATADLAAWNSQLAAFLPKPGATIACSQTGITYTPSANQVSMRPPYGGNCTMTITWSERQTGDTVGTDSSAITQQFVWEFQP
ncbi:type IV pilus modification protein PilV [Dyella halodurans]|uniref:Type IV pilus modification protein PilV n=1 Tax=Dyella halodurans TaxID=1920171 RepID=A0ABV9C5Y1_9GAMM|nr:type IV pilus modification protein PilV [Dyella halodurans]